MNNGKISERSDNMKVIFRKTKEGEIIAFLPEVLCYHGNIMSYMHIGQHSEASLEYYHNTEKASENEYTELLTELTEIYNDQTLEIKQRLYYNDLTKAWSWISSLESMAKALSKAEN